MNKFFKKLTKQLWEVVEILAAVLAVAVLVSALFGPDVPFFGGIMGNVQELSLIHIGRCRRIERCRTRGLAVT